MEFYDTLLFFLYIHFLYFFLYKHFFYIFLYMHFLSMYGQAGTLPGEAYN